MIKKLIKIALVCLVLAFVAAYLIVLFAVSPIVSNAVATFAPKVTGCDVKIEKVSVSPLLSGVTVKGVTVGNPQGFKTDSAFELTEFSVNVSLSSLLTDEIVVKEVVIDGAKVTLEQGLTTNNLLAIKNNVDVFLQKMKPEGEPVEKEEKPEAEESTSAKKVIVENFYFRNAEVRLSAVGLQGAAMKLPMVDLHIQDIGKDSGGASAGEVVKEIYDAIVKAVLDVSSKAGVGFDKAGEALKKGVDSMKNAAEGVKDQTKDLLKGTKESLKDLFK